MTILLGFFLPAVAFVVAAIVAHRAQPKNIWLAAGAALGAATLSAAVLFATVTRSAYWSDRTEIAWIGAEAGMPKQPLTIGGPPDSALVGWPISGFWPRLTATPIAEGQVRVQVSGGSGVVVSEPLKPNGAPDTDQQRVLNGTLIRAGETADIDGFQVSFRNRWFFADRLDIGKGGSPVASAPLRWNRSGVISIFPELAAAIARLRIGGDARKQALALELEDWSSQTRVYHDREGVRIVPGLHESAPTEWPAADIAVPARLMIRWPGRTLPIEVSEAHDGRVKVTFLPPWRLASPMPPPVEGARDLPLTLTTDPRPGERVFRMPFGGGLEDPRRALALRTGTNPPQFAGGTLPPRVEDLIDLPPGVQLGDDARRFKPAGLTSLLSVPAGPMSLQIATIQDLPTARRLAFMLAIGLGVLALGIVMTRSAVPAADAWSLYGLALSLWLFLNLRLLLSLRYAIDPTGLDPLSVRGVALAGLAMALLPGLFFHTIRLYRDAFLPRDRASRTRRFNFFMASLATLAVVVWTQVRLARGLWPNLPPRFAPDFGWIFLLFILGMFLLLAAQAVHTYLLDGDAQVRLWWLSPLNAVQKMIFGYGVRFWQRARTWRTGGRRYLVTCAALLIAYGVAAVALAVLNAIAGNQKIIQEFAGPFILAGIPLLFWLSSRAAVSIARVPILADWRGLAILSAVIIFPAILSPIALRDIGGLLASLAWFTPLAALLIALPPQRYGIWPAIWSVAVIVLAGAFLVASITFLPGRAVSMLERGISRYLVFARGEQAQRLLPLAQWSPEIGQGVPLRSLQNTIEHGWENVAIAHRGKWIGTGFSKGPARRSMVPQDTIQYDSTYSFFIVSEHGLAGGFCLLLLYGAPLGMILWSARRRLDVGHLLAMVIAAGFLGEAFVHVAMNYGALPFTGRNLPLLSVNSATEVLRWIVLWCLAGQAIFWRSTAEEQTFSPRFGTGVVRVPAQASFRPWRAAATAVVVVPVVFLALRIVWPGIRVARDPQLDAPFGWDRLLSSVQSLIDTNRIVWQPDKKQISLRPLGVELRGDTFLEQEVARFNSLPDDEKFDLPESVGLPLGRVRTIDEYDRVLHALQQLTTRASTRRPPLFTVSVTERHDDSDDEPERVERLEANPSFNIRLSFAPETEASRLPTAAIADPNPRRTNGAGVNIIGPAWVSGKWQVAVNPAASLPWTSALADALVTEWARLGSDEAARRYGKLTIDAELQAAAMSFAAEKGRDRHAELLKAGSANPRRQLPPRVALSIVDMRDGRVLAMGGWPHMSPGTRWTYGADGWSPPADWLDRHASRALSLRYGRDRNFDRIELGSAGKPLWAAAALSVHPQIDRLLQVQGGDPLEGEVFGIPIPGKPWKVPTSGWRNFREYLMHSDNRYQIRLGFLGIAAADGKSIRVDRARDRSPSIKESLTGRDPEPWRRYPEFLPDVRFSAANPSQLTLLHQTPLAQAMRTMFGAGIHSGDTPSYRTSMWSLAEDGAQGGFDVSDQFLSISPESARLRLDAVENPRQFISHLLGGADSRWANVEYAAAFATAITGRPLLPHVVGGDVHLRPGRDPFPRIAARLRPGLAAAVREDGGTATARLRTAGASIVFGRGLSAYGKTGTLSTDLGRTETSRLVIALVRWKDEAEGTIDAGVVLSLVVERAQMGAASSWLGEFLNRYEAAITRAGLR
jgi:FtsW/RodA/SpoVE-like cell cycle protein